LAFQNGNELREDENIVLEDGYAGFRQNLILTNMRLITVEKKGWFRTSLSIKKENPFEQIEEAYVKPGGAFVWNSAMLKMKNGESVELGMKLPESQAFAADFGGEGLAGMHQRLKAIKGRWVDATNNQLRAKDTQKLEDRIRELEEKLNEKEKWLRKNLRLAPRGKTRWLHVENTTIRQQTKLLWIFIYPRNCLKKLGIII
jgi:hypothetical protein